MTVCPDMLQVQPVPVATVGVRPVGRVSVTVTRPLVAAVPELVAVMVYVPVALWLKLPVWLLVIVRSGVGAIVSVSVLTFPVKSL